VNDAVPFAAAVAVPTAVPPMANATEAPEQNPAADRVTDAPGVGVAELLDTVALPGGYAACAATGLRPTKANMLIAIASKRFT
jgi:hypothetical protein